MPLVDHGDDSITRFVVEWAADPSAGEVDSVAVVAFDNAAEFERRYRELVAELASDSVDGASGRLSGHYEGTVRHAGDDARAAARAVAIEAMESGVPVPAEERRVLGSEIGTFHRNT